MRVGEDVSALLPNCGDDNASYNKDAGPDTWRDRRPNDVVGALTECAILMSTTIQMDVGQLQSGPEGEQYGDERDQQIAAAPRLWPNWRTPTHT
jgi:hypothetical protein